MFLTLIAYLRAWLGILSPSKVHEELGRQAMRHFWAGYEMAGAKAAWKKRHRLERIRAKKQRQAAQLVELRADAEALRAWLILNQIVKYHTTGAIRKEAGRALCVVADRLKLTP
jgi:ribosomal protein S21